MWNPWFRSIMTSSILHEGPVVVAVWALLVASADRNGESDLTIPYLASVLRISDEEVERAFAILIAPDKHSRTPDQDGRRITKLENGRWFLVSHQKHREMASKQMAVQRTQRYRARKAIRDRDATADPCCIDGCQNRAVPGATVCSKCAMEAESVGN